jgi:UDP-N-acetylmuramate--alanine ligase
MSAPDLLGLARQGHVHFVGVGGSGMSPLAELILRSGGPVSGCDARGSAITARLEALGARIALGHDPSHVADAVAVVTTSAVPSDHPELEEARRRGLPVLKRAEALGAIVNRGRVVAVAGTHGKSTTTAMTAEILVAGELDPTALVGGPVPAWEGNLRLGGRDLYVVEADEYDRSFHTLEADVAVVTNVDEDHLDVYGDLAGVREAFRGFLSRVRPGARVAVCADDPEASRLLAVLPVAGYAYGLSPGSQLRAVDLEAVPGGTRCRILEEGRAEGELLVRVPGVHNLRNALGAAAAARHLGVSWEAVRSGLERFTGVARRFQTLGEIEGVLVIDDYAHHPTEIAATLEAIRLAHPGRRLVAVFQPHLYSRTRDFADGFGRALALADVVWVTDVYPAREAPLPGVTGEVVADAARRHGGPGTQVRYERALEGLAQVVAEDLDPGDVVVTLGAGSVEVLGPQLVRRLGEVARA